MKFKYVCIVCLGAYKITSPIMETELDALTYGINSQECFHIQGIWV